MTPVHFTFPLADLEFADSGAGEGQRTIRGHAAVFNRLSHDLGGYRVKVAPGAFSAVLDNDPDVHLVWDHNTALTLARTRNKTLELREDPAGLHVWGRLAKTSYADDLIELMKRGDVDQMSFACDIGADEWDDSSDEITRTILEVGNLYDVTVCAQGAFPQTDSRLAADLVSAIETGRVSARADEDVAPQTAGDADKDAVAKQGSEIAALRAQASASQSRVRAALADHK